MRGPFPEFLSLSLSLSLSLFFFSSNIRLEPENYVKTKDPSTYFPFVETAGLLVETLCRIDNPEARSILRSSS